MPHPAEVYERLPELLGRPGHGVGSGVFRSSTAPTPSDDPGTWLPRHDPRILEWLGPFDGDVLVALGDDALPVYLHDPTNVASARTADASGFPDLSLIHI